MNPHWG